MFTSDYEKEYYRLMITDDDKVTIVSLYCYQEMTDFLQMQSKFIKDPKGELYYFEQEFDALCKLNEIVKPEYIDPKYLLEQSKYLK